MAFGIDDALLGGGLSAAGGLLGGLFGRKKDTTAKQMAWANRAGAFQDASRLMDAFYGSNWRSGYAAQQPANWQSVRHGDPTAWGAFRYGQDAAGNAKGPQAGTAAQQRATGLYGGTTPFGNLPILQQIQNASGAGMAANAVTLKQYRQGAEAAYRQAAKFGTGQNQVIESDAAKSLKNAQALAMARLQGSGLGGSTLASDALGAAAAGNLRELTRAKTDLADRATGLRLQQRNTANAGLAALRGQTNASNQALRMAPITAQLQVLQSGIANPYSGQSLQGQPAQYQPTGYNQIGDSLSTLGGLYLGKSLYNTGGGAGKQADTNLAMLNGYFGGFDF